MQERITASVCLTLAFILSACAVEEKPYYFLNDAPLRIFQSGDKFSYSVLDKSIFNYSITLTPKDEISPNTNNTLELLFEDQVISNNLSMPFLPQFYQQNESGDLIIKAIGNGGEVLWLLDSNNDEANEIWLPSDINSLSTPNQFTKKLQRCDEDQICTDAGFYQLFNMKLDGIETAETAYADFEAYKINLSVEIEIIDAEQAGISKIYAFSGSAWIHPLIGVIKFLYNTSTPNNNTLLVGPLSNTNVSIDTSYKAGL